MRIVAGKNKGRSLAAPKDQTTRPTSDRVRESLFNILEHGVEDFSLEDVRVLDLFAGTGALGLEALSRGAKYCLFIENSAAARGIIRTNVEEFHLTGITKIWRRDATSLGPAGNVESFNLVFADPPYKQGLGERALLEARDNGWIRSGAIAVLEESNDANLDMPIGYEVIDKRSYGETQIIIMRAT